MRKRVWSRIPRWLRSTTLASSMAASIASTTFRSAGLAPALRPRGLAGGGLDDVGELLRELAQYVVELSAGDRLAQRGEHRPDPLLGLDVIDPGALGHPANELVEPEALRVFGPRGQWLLQLLGQLGGEIPGLAAGDPFGQRLQGGPGERCGPLGGYLRPLSDGVEELVIVHGGPLSRPAVVALSRRFSVCRPGNPSARLAPAQPRCGPRAKLAW